MKKQTFQIEVLYQMAGTLFVEAETLEEAEQMAKSSDEYPYSSEYVELSIEIDKEAIGHGEIVESEEN